MKPGILSDPFLLTQDQNEKIPGPSEMLIAGSTTFAGIMLLACAMAIGAPSSSRAAEKTPKRPGRIDRCSGGKRGSPSSAFSCADSARFTPSDLRAYLMNPKPRFTLGRTGEALRKLASLRKGGEAFDGRSMHRHSFSPKNKTTRSARRISHPSQRIHPGNRLSAKQIRILKGLASPPIASPPKHRAAHKTPPPPPPSILLVKPPKNLIPKSHILALCQRIHSEGVGTNAPCELTQAVVRAESGRDPNIVSVKGAAGLMQLMPETAIRFGVDPKNLFDPYWNMRGGMRYFDWLLKHFKGDYRLAMAGYNAGERRAQKALKKFKETRRYAARIYRFLAENGPLARRLDYHRETPAEAIKIYMAGNDSQMNQGIWPLEEIPKNSIPNSADTTLNLAENGFF